MGCRRSKSVLAWRLGWMSEWPCRLACRWVSPLACESARGLVSACPWVSPLGCQSAPVLPLRREPASLLA